MKTIERTAKKVVIEVTKSEIKQRGFDTFWDEVRDNFPENLYEIDKIDVSEKSLLLTLKVKKY